MSDICKRIDNVKNEINKLVNYPVEIVVASKYGDSKQINELADCGHRVFGENRVQEMMLKAKAVPDVKWHFIGHLQTNKVKYVVGFVELIQSLDSIKLAEKINKEAAKKGIIQDVLIQVNIAKEDAKYGIKTEELDFYVKEVLNLSNIRLKGLMAIMPYLDEESLKPFYKHLKKLFDNIKLQIRSDDFRYLSAGMSNDWQLALKEGANMLRLGSVIFGG